jgi:hypothetical protein
MRGVEEEEREIAEPGIDEGSRRHSLVGREIQQNTTCKGSVEFGGVFSKKAKIMPLAPLSTSSSSSS